MQTGAAQDQRVTLLAQGVRAADNVFAWQGWALAMPGKWDAYKVEGDADDGLAHFVDLQQLRLEMAWTRVTRRRFNAEAWARKTMRRLAGKLAADEAVAVPVAGFDASMVYIDPHPPGRDVWIGHSPQSGRVIELIYHSMRRERVLMERLVSSLTDLPADKPLPWSVFGLSCVAPAGMALATHRLNAGDLSLTFADKTRRLTVRQVVMAERSLKLMPMEKWIAQTDRGQRKHYRPAGEAEAVRLDAGDGRTLTGMRRRLNRRKRFFFKRSLRPLVTVGLHDSERDRLLLVQATSDDLVEQVVPAIGWAQHRVPEDASRMERSGR